MSLRQLALHKNMVASFTEATVRAGQTKALAVFTLLETAHAFNSPTARGHMVKALAEEYRLPPLLMPFQQNYALASQLAQTHKPQEAEGLVRAVFFTVAHPRAAEQVFVSALVTRARAQPQAAIKAVHLELDGVQPGSAVFFRALQTCYNQDITGAQPLPGHGAIRRLPKAPDVLA